MTSLAIIRAVPRAMTRDAVVWAITSPINNEIHSLVSKVRANCSVFHFKSEISDGLHYEGNVVFQKQESGMRFEAGAGWQKRCLQAPGARSRTMPAEAFVGHCVLCGFWFSRPFLRSHQV